MKRRDVSVRPADPAVDRDRILAVLQRNLPEAAAADRLEWLYSGNPCGPPLVWLLEDAETGEPVGTGASHPRQMHVGDQVVSAIIQSDFAVDAAYRSLGPAVRLVRAMIEPVAKGEYAFSYDLPNSAMHSVHTRVGAARLPEMHRWVRPLAATPVLQRKLGGGILGRVMGAAGDAALRARDALTRSPAGIDLEIHAGPCGAEFDHLDRRVTTRSPVRGVRSSAYLEWRYQRHTMWSHDILCARRGRELAGYAVCRGGEADVVSLVDLFAVDEPDVRRALVTGVVSMARAHGAASISAEVLADCPAADHLKESGFYRREQTTGPVVFVPEDSPLKETLRSAGNWWLVQGDRDV